MHFVSTGGRTTLHYTVPVIQGVEEEVHSGTSSSEIVFMKRALNSSVTTVPTVILKEKEFSQTKCVVIPDCFFFYNPGV